MNETAWPPFLEQLQTFSACFDALADRVIGQALEVKAGEVEERSESAHLEPVVQPGSLL